MGKLFVGITGVNRPAIDAFKMSGKSIHAAVRIFSAEILMGIFSDNVDVSRILKSFLIWITGGQRKKKTARLENPVDFIHKPDKQEMHGAISVDVYSGNMFYKIKC